MVKRMTSGEAVKAVRKCETVGFTVHALDEMFADKISRLEVLTALKSGNIFKPAEQDIKTGDWKYRMEARVMNRNIAVVLTFRTVDRLTIITVWEVR